MDIWVLFIVILIVIILRDLEKENLFVRVDI